MIESTRTRVIVLWVETREISAGVPALGPLKYAGGADSSAFRVTVISDAEAAARLRGVKSNESPRPICADDDW